MLGILSKKSRIIFVFILALVSIVTVSEPVSAITTWTPQNSGTTQWLYGITYGNGIFVATGENGTILTSTDGTSWTSRTSGTTNKLNEVRYGNGTFVAVGISGTILTSTNGTSWTPRTSGTTRHLEDVIYASSTFVTTGWNGTILTSPNGTTWTPQTSGTTNLLSAITYGNGTFVAAGSTGTLRSSTNITTWTVRTSGTANSLSSVTYGNGMFVAGGDNGTIRTSATGTSWTSQTSGTSTSIEEIIYGDDKFVAVGGFGMILTSPYPILYTLTFNSNGGSAVSSIIAASSTVITPPANPTRSGYTFEGWSPSLPLTMPAANQTYTAQWANTYTVSYNSNTATGGSVPSNQTKTYDVALTLATNSGNLAKTGYTFVGWNTTAGGGGTDYATSSSYTNNASTTLYAKWNINQYTLTFNTDGGSAVSSITQNYNTAVTSPTNPTKTGYTFTGWSPTIPANMPATNQTHTAQWTPNQYTLTFDSDGGSAVSPITDDYNAVVTAPADPTKAGYTFTGWSPSLPLNIPASDETYTAQWSINQYTLTFDTDGGSVISPITDDFGASVTDPSDPTKEGYIFGGWNPALPATIPSSDQTYTALWNVDQFSITFDSNGGSVVGAITDDFGATVTPPTNPTREGYTFTGWSPTLPSTMPASNNAHTAQWSVNQYTLTFDSDGGSAVSPIIDDYASTITPPTFPTKTGYTFTGWSPTLPGTIPSSDETYTAQWSINQYTLTFNTDGGTAVAPITDDYNAVVTTPTSPTKTGYTFTGWSPSIPSNIPASDETYTAQWSALPITLSSPIPTPRLSIGGSTAYCDPQNGITNFCQQNTTQLKSEPIGMVFKNSTCYTHTNSLSRGQKSPQILKIQQILQSLGFISKTTVLNGLFGPATFAGVKNFQKVNNIQQVGFVGPLTGKMFSAVSCK